MTDPEVSSCKEDCFNGQFDCTFDCPCYKNCPLGCPCPTYAKERLFLTFWYASFISIIYLFLIVIFLLLIYKKKLKLHSVQNLEEPQWNHQRQQLKDQERGQTQLLIDLWLLVCLIFFTKALRTDQLTIGWPDQQTDMPSHRNAIAASKNDESDSIYIEMTISSWVDFPFWSSESMAKRVTIAEPAQSKVR